MKVPEYIQKAAKKFRENYQKINSQTKKRSEISIKPSQIWKIFLGEKDFQEAMFVLTTSLPFQQSNASEAIRVLPIHNTPLQQCICKQTDLLLAPESVPIKLTSLIEWWNEITINITQLELYFGTLEEKHWELVQKLLKEQPEPINAPSITLFRQEEKKIIASLLSKSKAATALPAQPKPLFDTLAAWFFQLIEIPEFEPALQASDVGLSEPFKHFRKHIINEIVRQNDPNNIDAWRTDEGLTIQIGEQANIAALALIDKDGQTLATFQFKALDLKITENCFKKWEQVSSFKFLTTNQS